MPLTLNEGAHILVPVGHLLHALSMVLTLGERSLVSLSIFVNLYSDTADFIVFKLTCVDVSGMPMHLPLSMSFVIHKRASIIIVLLSVVQSALPLLFSIKNFTFVSIQILVCYDADASHLVVHELSLIFVAIGPMKLAASLHLTINHQASEAISIWECLFNYVTANDIALTLYNFL